MKLVEIYPSVKCSVWNPARCAHSWKSRACWDLCGLHLLYGEPRCLRSVLTLVKHRIHLWMPGIDPSPGELLASPLELAPKWYQTIWEKHRSCDLCNLNVVSKRKQSKKQLRCHCDGSYSCKHSQSCKLFTCERFGCEFKAQTRCLCDEVLCISFEEKCLVQALELLCLRPRKGLGEGDECGVCRRP